MKTIIKIALVVLIGYFVWPQCTGKKLSDLNVKSISEKKDNQTIILKGKVTGNIRNLE